MKENKLRITVELSIEDILGEPKILYRRVVLALFQQASGAAVNPVLNSFLRNIRQGEFKHTYNRADNLVYYLLEGMENCVQPENAEEVAEILITDEIAQDGDRSNKCRLVAILKKIGNEKTIPYLVQYANKARDELVDMDKTEARNAIDAILERVLPSQQNEY